MEKSYLLRFKNLPNFKDLDQYSKETTPLNQILGGYLRSTVSCLSCKHDSITFQHFEDLSLDITRVCTLNEALAGYFSRENLEECGYKCESCKKKVSATKRFSLERAPAVLCIQLKRFNVMGGKLSKQIQISQNLDLSKHLAKAGDTTQNCNYKLVSMVTHLGGSASGGHYTAIGITPNGNYCHFDDSCVSPISTESVLRTNAYVIFYELVPIKPKQNGQNLMTHNNFYQNEHTYSKCAPSTTTISPASSRTDFDRLREDFAKPNLPKMIPSSLIRQNQLLKQKENETTPPQKMAPSTSKTFGNTNGNSKASLTLFPSVRANGKREASDDEKESFEIAAKKIKPSLPSLPRLTGEVIESSPKSSYSPSTTSASALLKPKSLVPYETDDDDDDEPPTASSNGKKAESDRVNFCRTSSGVFVETDAKENPSKHGSTVDKIVVTKASLTNDPNGLVNLKSVSNGYQIKRNDDTIQQLTKQPQNGYGTSNVVSWNNTPTNMNQEVIKDLEDDRKRQVEDSDEAEMDAGRTKKLKYGNRHPQSFSGKLPNPFQEQQNVHNQNGSNRSYQVGAYFNSDRSYGRNQSSYQNQNGHNRHNGGKFKGSYKPRDHHFGFNHQHSQNRNNGKFNKRFNDRR